MPGEASEDGRSKSVAESVELDRIAQYRAELHASQDTLRSYLSQDSVL